MSSSFDTTTFYVAPSKERHPLVSKLLQWVDGGVDGKPRSVKNVTRVNGFLKGEFETCDGQFWDVEFEKLYMELGELGYISEDHRYRWWSSNGDGGSTWYDYVGDTAYKTGTKEVHYFDEEDAPRSYRKKEARKFWEEFPNLMHILKYDRTPEVQPQTLV